MKRKILWVGLSFLLVAALVLASCGEAVPGEQEEEEEEEEEPKPGEGLVIYFQMGGAPGMPCTDPAIAGAKLAAEVWGVELKFQSANWDMVKMVDQLREAVAARPDGIVVIGMIGEAATELLFEEAIEAGIVITAFQESGMPTFDVQYKDQGFAFMGVGMREAGLINIKATIENAGLKAGDRILLYDHLGPYPRELFSEAILEYAEEQGMIIDWVINPAEHLVEVEYASSIIAGYVAAHPDTKAIIVWHGIFSAESETILRGAGFTDPDDIWFSGADINPATIEALESGWTDSVTDYLLSMQGYFTVQQIVLTKLYQVPGMPVCTGPVVHTWESIQPVIPLIEAGLR